MNNWTRTIDKIVSIQKKKKFIRQTRVQNYLATLVFATEIYKSTVKDGSKTFGIQKQNNFFLKKKTLKIKTLHSNHEDKERPFGIQIKQTTKKIPFLSGTPDEP